MRTLANVFPLGISGSSWRLSDADEAALREHGFSEGEIAEIIANVALNVFTNYFNVAADVEIDFPKAPALTV